MMSSELRAIKPEMVRAMHDPFHVMDFHSRRSPVLGTRGMVASSQPLASEAGMRILQQGGNAADAAVAMAAALNVTEPCSTGIGGDAFALFYSASTREVTAMLGNGRSPVGLTMEAVRAQGIKGHELPADSALCVTVPGAAALWEDTVKSFGTLSLEQVLQPAIELAEQGFPVSPVTAYHWEISTPQLRGPGKAAFLTPDGRAPAAGEIQRNPDLAATFRSLAKHGALEGFYRGRIAAAIVDVLKKERGVMTADDLAHHRTVTTRPIHTSYRGYTIYEVPPPTQGIAALMALNSLELEEQLDSMPWGSAEHMHAAIESMRLGFVDALQYNADPEVVPVPTDDLLSKEYAKRRRADLFRPNKAARVTPGNPIPDATAAAAPSEARRSGDTVYFCVVDGHGNGCSFINSNYLGFGSGIVPEGCGFTLQNRGHGFILDPKHPNCLGPRKWPYHTIIPGLATDPEGNLYCTFGVMGAFQQPQGHMQVISNMLDFGLEPQTALDAPRFSLYGVDSAEGPSTVLESIVLLEEGFSDEAVEGLRKRGHTVHSNVRGHDRAVFGRGQIIKRDPKTGVLWGGSEPRADGQVLGW
ncbi:Glutathione hydrolase proenzyme [Coccomyxa sp. Obi]|nr:Glutathione hydrolase proenzyme [Coccomyxa sp. Obi]